MSLLLLTEGNEYCGAPSWVAGWVLSLCILDVRGRARRRAPFSEEFCGSRIHHLSTSQDRPGPPQYLDRQSVINAIQQHARDNGYAVTIHRSSAVVGGLEYEVERSCNYNRQLSALSCSYS